MEYKYPTEDEKGREAESERVRRMMMLNRFHLFQDYSRAATGNHENGALLTPISTEKLEIGIHEVFRHPRVAQNCGKMEIAGIHEVFRFSVMSHFAMARKQ